MSRLRTRQTQKAEKMKLETSDTDQSPKLKRWTEEELRRLLYNLKLFGHRDLENISSQFPNRSKDDIRKLLISVHSQARKTVVMNSDIQYWLNRSTSERKRNDMSKTNKLFHVAQVMKFLSVDGLLENQPSPENCGGIDFVAAYRLLYQALMGYPLQPVNQATANFIIESLNGLSKNKNASLISDMTKFLKKKFGVPEESALKSNNSDPGTSSDGNPGTSSNGNPGTLSNANKKPVIVYQRKKPPVSENTERIQPLKVVFQEEPYNRSPDVKSYTIAIDGTTVMSNVRVPVIIPKPRTEVEEAASSLWKSTEFNPLEFPESYFTRPINYEY